jgi:RecA/RadA recombinase
MLDWCLGGHGLPAGRIVEVFSENHVGKTALSLAFAKQVLVLGGKVVYLDSEWGLDRSFCRLQGVDPEAMCLLAPSCLEEVHELIEKTVQHRCRVMDEPTLIVCDSIPG